MSKQVRKFVRFSTSDTPAPQWGEHENETVHLLSSAPWNTHHKKIGQTFQLKEITLLAPAEPTKIIAFGYNYHDLVQDPEAISGEATDAGVDDKDFEPVLFLKGPNALNHPHKTITVPKQCTEAWIENELAIVIGKQAKNLTTEKEADQAIFGHTIGNDVSTLNILGRDWHLARSKSLDGFCPLGPELISGLDVTDLIMKTWINERLTQNSTTANRILNSAQTVLLISTFMTLEPGDVILTGSPRGARQSVVCTGDMVTLEIEELGRLKSCIKN